MDVGLRTLKLRQLRLAIQRNAISFPATRPDFDSQQEGELQWRVAYLFFLSGWSLRAVGQRYKLPAWRAGLLIRAWIDAAISQGYVQDIPPESKAPTGSDRPTVEFRVVPVQPDDAVTFPSAGSNARPLVPNGEARQGSRGRKHYSDNEIAAILRQVEEGGSVQEICRTLGISPRTFHAWKSKFGGMTVSGMDELRRLQDENRKLRDWSAAVTLMLAHKLQKQ